MRALVLLLVLLTACAAPASSPAAPGGATPTVDRVARVTPAQAKAIADGRRGVIVDVRSAADFAQRRVAGALNVPLEGLMSDPRPAALTAIPADQEIILYCT
ncbi:MAG: rhodanese-like domain-containing protein [Dehalococcoidia bacterium]